jgi:hypothetical protein
MKKLLVLVLSAILVLSFVVVPHAGATAPSYWTGDPDPMKCDFFHDCHYVIPVCIDGTTYQIGLYFDPAFASPKQIEDLALYWSNTVLTAGVCPWVGYSIPHVILYKGTELTNGFGIIVSTEAFVSVENVLAAFKLTAPLPADVVPVCEGPVVQMNPDDKQGKWVCDSLLVGILANGHSGLRYPLISGSGQSLQKVYNGLIGLGPWIAP